MSQPTPALQLPDNLISRLSRVYIDKRQFTDASGKPITYERLILEVLIKGEVFKLEFKPEQKDVAILMLADVLGGNTQTSVL